MSNAQRTRGSDGFTLIELLIVTAILGLLAVFASHALVDIADRVIVSSGAAPSPEMSPERSQAAQLVQLAGLAILLFGGGFWYLVELRHPGRLDKFRLGHFLLLALTFSLFFIVFAVLDARELSPGLAAGIAAGISYPLVVMHVRTIVSWRFAITSALPLAAFTTGIAINGVYGGELRGLIFLAMLCAVVAFLTWSYPRLARTLEATRSTETADLTRRTMALSALTLAVRSQVADAKRLLQQPDPTERQGLRSWLEQRVENASRTIDDFERLNSVHNRMLYVASRRGQKLARITAMDLAIELDRKMPQAQTALKKAADSLLSLRELTDLPAAPAALGHHCVGCGHPSDEQSHYCGNCGRPSAERRQCPRCAHVLHLPRHLLQANGEGQALATHCHCCGERHATAG